MLAVAKSTDVPRAPAADMFEMGVTVQVLAKERCLPSERSDWTPCIVAMQAWRVAHGERAKVEEILGQTIEAAWASAERSRRAA